MPKYDVASEYVMASSGGFFVVYDPLQLRKDVNQISNYEDHFWKKVDKAGPDDCWIWLGGQLPTGYGLVTWHDRTKVYAHRLSWMLTYGYWPRNQCIDHLCNNPECVNPNHLRDTTDRENLLRSPITVAGINARKTHCIHGHRFDAINTYHTKDGRRVCRACTNSRARQYRAAKRKDR